MFIHVVLENVCCRCILPCRPKKLTTGRSFVTSHLIPMRWDLLLKPELAWRPATSSEPASFSVLCSSRIRDAGVASPDFLHHRRNPNRSSCFCSNCFYPLRWCPSSMCVGVSPLFLLFMHGCIHVCTVCASVCVLFLCMCVYVHVEA